MLIARFALDLPVPTMPEADRAEKWRSPPQRPVRPTITQRWR